MRDDPHRQADAADRAAKLNLIAVGAKNENGIEDGDSRPHNNGSGPFYRNRKDPFEALDRSGVGELMKIAIAKGRTKRPDIKIGICGEHGGEPSSVEFCHQIGQDYVSCSPFRVPIARLAAARAALREDTSEDKRLKKGKASKKKAKK